MALEKMRALATYLKQKELFAAEQLDYWMENGASKPAAKKIGDGLLICRFQYDAVFSMERFKGDADLFLALLSVWLMENDKDRDNLELGDPKIDVNPLDDLLVDLEVSVRFDEGITILPDENGLIVYKGKNYSVAPATITDANKVGVGDSQQRDVDKPYERQD